MDPFKAAQILLVGRDAGHFVARVELDYFIAFTRADVLHLESYRNIIFRRLFSRCDLKIRVRECRITQPISEIIEGAIHTRLFTLPLRLWFRREVEWNLAHRPR